LRPCIVFNDLRLAKFLRYELAELISASFKSLLRRPATAFRRFDRNILYPHHKVLQPSAFPDFSSNQDQTAVIESGRTNNRDPNVGQHDSRMAFCDNTGRGGRRRQGRSGELTLCGGSGVRGRQTTPASAQATASSAFRRDTPILVMFVLLIYSS
jgi:hypothetical protein